MTMCNEALEQGFDIRYGDKM